MEFTTHFVLQSQTTRLNYVSSKARSNGSLTLYAALFQGTSTKQYRKHTTILRFELFPVHSPLLGESLLVSFPPLNYMLKFSG